MGRPEHAAVNQSCQGFLLRHMVTKIFGNGAGQTRGGTSCDLHTDKDALGCKANQPQPSMQQKQT